MTNGASQRGVRLAGLGGQGVILAGVILGQAAVKDGLYAAGSNSYGAQARGSACLAEVVISRQPIDYPHMEEASLLVAMSQGGYDACHGHMAPDGIILYDSALVRPIERDLPQHGLDVAAQTMTRLASRQAGNLVWVGAAAAVTGWFSLEGLRRAVEQTVPARFLAVNLRALDLGLELARGVKEGGNA
jgi:2-oxoglutarate ferredoxin oxidoreductase subunit gamma